MPYNPFASGVVRIGNLVLAHDKLSVIVATVIPCALLYLFFNQTRLGTARNDLPHRCRRADVPMVWLRLGDCGAGIAAHAEA